MNLKLFLEDYEKIISDVKPEEAFWIYNGPTIRNLHELKIALETMDKLSFFHHVNEEKNDFENWIRHAIHDEELADSIRKAKNKKKALKRVSNRISYVERKIDRERLKDVDGIHYQDIGSLNDKFKLLLVFIVGLLIGIIVGIFVGTFTNITQFLSSL